jgi:hypothetical protein
LQKIIGQVLGDDGAVSYLTEIQPQPKYVRTAGNELANCN